MSKVMETITFPGGSEPYQVRDGRIPESPGNYQYLVTDGDRQWGTADRLAYEGEDAPSGDPTFDRYCVFADYMNEYFEERYEDDVKKNLVVGNTYRVTFDWEKAKGATDEDINKVFVGDTVCETEGGLDLYVTNIDNPEESFRIGYLNSGYIYMYTRDLNEKMPAGTLTIDELVPQIVPIDPKFLPSGVPVVPVTSADNGKFLQVVNGAWAAVAVTDVSQEGA